MPGLLESNAEKRIVSHTVFVTVPQSAVVGSGVHIKLADRDFVFSAAHVIEGAVKISLGLDTPQTPFTLLRKGLDPDHDVGYLELKPSEVLLLRGEKNSAYTISKSITVKGTSNKSTFAISGFPNLGAKPSRGRISYGVTLLRVPILAPVQWPSAIAETNNPVTDILVPFGLKHDGFFVSREGSTLERIDPRGFSGAGVWYIDPETEHSDAPRYSLLGIQRGFDDFYEVLYVSNVETLVNLICRDYEISVPKV